jgi:hypothetical protein
MQFDLKNVINIIIVVTGLTRPQLDQIPDACAGTLSEDALNAPTARESEQDNAASFGFLTACLWRAQLVETFDCISHL